MAVYKYKTKDRAGRVRTGNMNANSKAVVRANLRRMRLVPLSIKEERPDGSAKGLSLDYFYYRDREGKIQLRLGYTWPKTRDIAVFSRQFSSMLSSGVPMLKCLEVMRDQQRLYDFAKTLEDVRKAVERGKSLSEGMMRHVNIFDTLYVSMVKAGEASGQLDTIVRRLSDHLDKLAKIISQTKSALYYPAIVTIVSIAIIIGMLVFVVPVFAQQFASAGQELPELTRWVIMASNFIREHYIIFTCIVFGLIISIRLFLKTKYGQRVYDKYIMEVPAIGDLIKKTVVARFCYTMSAMLSAGVNMIEALSICATASNNKIVEEFILGVRSKVEKGEGLSNSMQGGDIFTSMVTSMVAVGEQTGALDEMLAKIAEIYEEEVEEQVKALLSLLEPVTIVVIGGCIGFIVVAMYLPIFDLGKIAGA